MVALAACFLSINAVSAEYSSYPNGLLTDSYGLVSEDDLAFDAHNKDVEPYRPGANEGVYWQCLDPKQVEAKYRTWPLEETLGQRETYCAAEFWIKGRGDAQLYTGRRGLPVSYCQDVMRTWRRLTKDQSVVCLNGEGSLRNKDSTDDSYLLLDFGKVQNQAGMPLLFCRLLPN